MLLVEQRERIEPGGFSEVAIEVPTSGMEGPFAKRFKVVTDAPEADLHEFDLVLRGEIRATVEAVPSQIQFGNVAAGEVVRRPLDLRSRFVDIGQTLQSVESSSPYVTVRVLDKKPGLLKCEIEVAKDAPAGELAAMLSFHFDFPEFPVVKVLVLGRCAGGDLEVFPSHVVLRTTEGSSGLSSKVRLQSRSRRPFHILAAEPPPGVEVSWQPVNDQKSAYEIRVAVKDPSTQPTWLQTISLKTDQGQETVKIPVMREPTKAQAGDGRKVPPRANTSG